jgi:hypothetical protein
MKFIGLPNYQDKFDFRFCDVYNYNINDTIVVNKEIIQNNKII